MANTIPGSYSAPAPSTMSTYNATEIVNASSIEGFNMTGPNLSHHNFSLDKYITTSYFSNLTIPLMFSVDHINGHNNEQINRATVSKTALYRDKRSADLESRCPEPIHWNIMANYTCNNPQRYMCLFDISTEAYRELCDYSPDFDRPGSKR